MANKNTPAPAAENTPAPAAENTAPPAVLPTVPGIPPVDRSYTARRAATLDAIKEAAKPGGSKPAVR